MTACLDRMQRHVEAVAALEHVADGPPGSYRDRAIDLLAARGV